jgi:RNA polymerase sigma factor (TIGR02999 family)
MGDSKQLGDSRVDEHLIPVLYEELRKIAAHKMACEAPGQTLQPTALVHEAWLRLAGNGNPQWQNRAHFFGAAAEAMRRILVERARRKQRLKRGGDWERVEFDEMNLAAPIPDQELLALDEALRRLDKVDPRAAEVVNLCFFAGLTQEEAARQLEVSISTVERTWSFARAWLFREVRKSREAPG